MIDNVMHNFFPESESEVGGWVGLDNKLQQKGRSSPAHVLFENNRAANQQQVVPTTSTQSPRFGRTLSSGGPMAMRPHAFCQKTVIKPETCEPCGKRIKFSKLALKCRDCKATCHPECKDKVPIPCVSTGTPSNKNHVVRNNFKTKRSSIFGWSFGYRSLVM